MLVLEKPKQLTGFQGCAFVPTMGSLHEGHLALIRRARETGLPVIVSIFVNPTQFGPNEDFARYPRQLSSDVDLAASAGARAVFAPSVDTMYPPNEVITPPKLPAVATQPGLEDRIRPDHFDGVCQIVARLFDMVRPGVAVFGEKDFQQLLVIRAMVKQESPRWGDLVIRALQTVRDPDGLAMSSRNAYLKEGQREQALALSRALESAKEARTPADAEARMQAELNAAGLETDYAVVRDAETLLPVTSFDRPCRALMAARLGTLRLIDNAPLPERSPSRTSGRGSTGLHSLA